MIILKNKYGRDYSICLYVLCFFSNWGKNTTKNNSYYDRTNNIKQETKKKLKCLYYLYV